MSSTKKLAHQFDAVIALPFCHLGLNVNKGELLASEYLKPEIKTFVTDSSTVTEIVRQIEAYCENPTFNFQLELKPAGTVFQQKVWQVLSAIPAGQVMTYGEVAKQLSSSAQAVGNACRANPIPLIIPCHRVVSAQGIGGFAGHTSGYFTDIKSQLLAHEGLEF